MGRMRVALTAIGVAVCCSTTGLRAQTTAPPDGWVVLPVDEYKALRERAFPPAPPPSPPPVEAALTRIDYELRADGESSTGQALLTVDVLTEGWVRVQMPSGLLVRDARLDGRPVPLVEGPSPHVLLSRPGRALLTLEIVVPLVSASGAESIVLPSSSAPISRATLVLARTGVDVSASGGYVAERTQTANESRFVAFGHPGQPLTLSWKRRVDDRRAQQPLRIRGRVTELVTLGEDTCFVTASVRVEVVQGLAREVTLAMPAGLSVNQVDGATVGEWDTSGSTLRVRLLEATAGETAFVVQAEMRAPREGPVAVPMLRLPSAERETGGVAVDVVGAGEIAGRQARGLEPTDASELAELTAHRESPSMIAFRRRPLTGSDPRSLNVTVVRYIPQAVLVANVEEARYRAIASEDGRLLVEARYAVRNNQRSFLKVTMPAESTLWSAELAGRPIRPGVAASDEVLLPLEKGRAGEPAPTFVVRLVYLQHVEAWPDRGRMRLDLPALDLPVSRTGLALHYSPRFRVGLDLGAFRVDNDPGPFAEALRATPAPVLTRSSTGLQASSERERDERASAGLQALADRFTTEGGARTVMGALPVHVAFPTFGPSIFLASELTAEAQMPSVQLTFRRVER
jgi:hypothetical protein